MLPPRSRFTSYNFRWVHPRLPFESATRMQLKPGPWPTVRVDRERGVREVTRASSFARLWTLLNTRAPPKSIGTPSARSRSTLSISIASPAHYTRVFQAPTWSFLESVLPCGLKTAGLRGCEAESWEKWSRGAERDVILTMGARPRSISKDS